MTQPVVSLLYNDKKKEGAKMMLPIGAIALATILDFKSLCEEESDVCEEIIKDLDLGSEKLDKIGKILFEEEKEDNVSVVTVSTSMKKLQALQNHKRKFYEEEFLPLVEKFNKQGVSYIPKKKPSKKEYLLKEGYDSVELERVIKKHYSDIKVYHTITLLRSDVYLANKKGKKTKKAIHEMLDELYKFLSKRVVKSNGKIKKEVENEFK